MIFLRQQDNLGKEEGEWGGGNLGLQLRKGGGKSKLLSVRLTRTASLRPNWVGEGKVGWVEAYKEDLQLNSHIHGIPIT